jgi:hypothetical protein
VKNREITIFFVLPKHANALRNILFALSSTNKNLSDYTQADFFSYNIRVILAYRGGGYVLF